jgi:hypothetical protein
MIPTLEEALGWLASGEVAPDPNLKIDPKLAERAKQVAACFHAFPEVLELIFDLTLRRSPVDHRLEGAAYRQHAQLRMGQNQVAASLLEYLATAERLRHGPEHTERTAGIPGPAGLTLPAGGAERPGEPEPEPDPTGPGADPANPSPPDPAADPAVAEAAAAAAFVPADAAGYKLDAEALKPFLVGGDADPVAAELRAFAHANGLPQGWIDQQANLVKHLSEKGLLGDAFDPAAELTALGENGPARQQEQETFLTSLKENGQLDDDEYSELMQLVPTAAGTRALEKMRARMTGNTDALQPPAAPSGDPKADQLAKYRAQRADPKYETDKAFRKQTDQLFIDLHP